MSFSELIAGKTGHGLIAFSDPAGAKACLAFAWMLRAQHLETTFQLVSNKSYDFYTDWDLPVEVTADPDLLQLEGVSWVFTGTSHPDSSKGFEAKLIRRAAAQGIQTESLIDHRTNLSLRFKLENTYVFPDRIYVTDEQLIPQAAAENIPEDKLAAAENPYLAYIRDHWKSTTTREAFRKAYGIRESVETVITYAPDPVSLRNDAFRFRFDEFSVLRELLTLMQHSNKHFLIIKVHPLQELALIRRIMEEKEYRNTCIDTGNRCANLELMQHSDAIVGFYSNFLLEAHALGKTIYRYFPDENDPFETAFRHVAARFRQLPALAGALNL